VKGALLLIGAGAAAVVGIVWFLRRSLSTVNVSAGAVPLPADAPDAAPSGKITNIDRDAFQGFTFSTTLTNASAKDQTFDVAFDMTPSGGLQFGVDPFHARQIVIVPARSSVNVDFIDHDVSLTLFASGKATLSINGVVVDTK
jgi:hypothetical protein